MEGPQQIDLQALIENTENIDTQGLPLSQIKAIIQSMNSRLFPSLKQEFPSLVRED